MTLSNDLCTIHHLETLKCSKNIAEHLKRVQGKEHSRQRLSSGSSVPPRTCACSLAMPLGELVYMHLLYGSNACLNVCFSVLASFISAPLWMHVCIYEVTCLIACQKASACVNTQMHMHACEHLTALVSQREYKGQSARKEGASQPNAGWRAREVDGESAGKKPSMVKCLLQILSIQG